MDIFDDLDFLGFVKQKLEEEIDFQEKLIENQRNNFFDKQLDFELHKELYRLYIWKDRIQEYIQNKISVLGNRSKNILENKEEILLKNRKLLESNRKLVEQIEELKQETKLLNEEINELVKKK
jgi:hypothetical protein